MEVYALNEQLREEFAGVVKYFLAIRREEITRVAAATREAAAPSSPTTKTDETSPTPSTDEKPLVPAPQQLSPGSLLPERTQKYAMLAKTILQKVNMYEYQSREQFRRDITELLVLADSNDQKVLLQHLVDQQRALTASTKPPNRAKRQKVNGIRIDSAVIPGIQCRTPTEWACNIDMRGNTSTISCWKSREKALEKGYKEDLRDAFRRMPKGESALNEMASDLQTACATFDREILQDAMKQVKQRLPISKHHDVASLSAALALPAPPPSTTTQNTQVTTPPVGKEKENGTKPGRKRELVIDTNIPQVTTTSEKPITPAAATPDLVAKRKPTDNLSRVSFLRLRRLIQIRLCRHLEGREICARLNEPGLEESWVATGRLERGKVLNYHAKKHQSFSEFVLTTLKRSVAACEHIFLLDTREHIDAHLLVCDQFDDDFRQRLDDNFKEVSELYKQGRMN